MNRRNFELISSTIYETDLLSRIELCATLTLTCARAVILSSYFCVIRRIDMKSRESVRVSVHPFRTNLNNKTKKSRIDGRYIPFQRFFFRLDSSCDTLYILANRSRTHPITRKRKHTTITNVSKMKDGKCVLYLLLCRFYKYKMHLQFD